ncbi:alpha/beta fold hydrolase [Clostridiaceae bacterium M8S5]|nr:alpha/beta fold hydrolase [Clostridiaceae bacterium M8S5]
MLPKKLKKVKILTFTLIIILFCTACSSTEKQLSKDNKDTNFKRPFKISNNVYPFDSHVYSWKGYNFHYIDQHPSEKSKGTVLAVHGNATWGIVYRKMVKPLTDKGFRVIVVDLLGFGMSDKPPVAEFDYMPHSHARVLTDFIKANNLNNIYLALQDWGGPIGLATGVEMPKRINGILLMNTWAWELEPIPDGEFGPYHVVYDRGIDAKKNPEPYLEGDLIKRGGIGLAKRNAKEGTTAFIELRNAQWGPFFNLEEPYQVIDENVTKPFHIFAKATVEDNEFLRNLDNNMKKLHSKPVYFMFGDDTAFGPLKVDLGQFGKRKLCPDNYKPQDEKPTFNTNCVDSNGNLVWPYLDRFLNSWDKDKVIGVWKDPTHGHWLQDEVPEIAVDAIEKLYQSN